MKKIFIGIGILVLSLILGIGGYFLLNPREEVIETAGLDLTVPYTSSRLQKVSQGEYQGERKTTVDGKATEAFSKIDTEQFFIYSYNSIPTVKGKKSDLWVENRSANVHNLQVYIVDTATKRVVYISPVLKPGEFVKDQDLITKDIQTGVSYEVWNCLYTDTAGGQELYGLTTSTINFSKN